MNPIYEKSKIFLRPTNTDGDSICVREALDSNCVVIASDVVDRPKEVICFENRNIDDFVNKIKDVIANISYYKDKIPVENDFYGRLLSVYNSYNL
jgi:glycosyltransferase involved in cell wall biosynthesis